MGFARSTNKSILGIKSVRRAIKKKKKRKEKKPKKFFFYTKIKSFADVVNITYMKSKMDGLDWPSNLFIINNYFKAHKIYKHCEKARKQGLINVEHKESGKIGYGITSKGVKFIEERRKIDRNEQNISISKERAN